MDETQKILIKAGRKDLAQKYYEKVSHKKVASTYTVMGAHPGDGATVNGTSFEDAFANFCRLDNPDVSKQEMLQDFKDQGIEFKKISPTEVQAGDYTIQKD